MFLDSYLESLFGKVMLGIVFEQIRMILKDYENWLRVPWNFYSREFIKLLL